MNLAGGGRTRLSLVWDRIIYGYAERIMYRTAAEGGVEPPARDYRANGFEDRGGHPAPSTASTQFYIKIRS